jgi:hypothetical protein
MGKIHRPAPAKAARKADALAGLERGKARYSEAAARLQRTTMATKIPLPVGNVPWRAVTHLNR